MALQHDSVAYGPRSSYGGRPTHGAPPPPATTGVQGVTWREQVDDRYHRMPAVAEGPPRTLTRRIADALCAGIQDGAYRQGERLPEIRVLANRYRCTTDTARNALAQVCERGLARQVRGVGTFVTGRWPIGPQPAGEDGGAAAATAGAPPHGL